jgi:glycosidase
VDEGSVDMAFEFDIATALLDSASGGNKRNIYDRMRSILPTYDYGQWATFTTNHDQARLLTQLNGNVDANKMAASMLLLGQGSPFIYYGEEIGMMGNKPDELIRTPMQWNDTATTGGFTEGTPWQPLTPDFEQRTVAGQTDDPDSLLNHYRALVHLRNETEALSIGQTELVESTYRSVYSFLRYTDDEVVLVILNLDNDPTRDFTLTMDENLLTDVSDVEVLFGEMDPAVPAINEEGGFTEYIPFDEPMPPYTTMVIRLR